MRLGNARFVGKGSLVGGVKTEIGDEVYLTSGGTVVKYLLGYGRKSAAKYGGAYAPLSGGAVTRKGGKLIYE